MGRKRMSTHDWYIIHGLKLRDTMKLVSKIQPDIVNEYRDHTALKLMSVGYWSEVFTTILNNMNIPTIYIDICSGSGLTKIKDDIKLLPGSTIVADEYASSSYKHIICVECDKEKAKALEERLENIRSKGTFSVICGKSEDEIDTVVALAKKQKGIAFTFIDPEGFEGFNWQIYDKISDIRGDILITWDCDGIWRIRRAGHEKKMNEIFGDSSWKEAKNQDELTDLFINRLNQKRDIIRTLDIADESRIVYKLILCVKKTAKGSPWITAFEDHLRNRIEIGEAKSIKKWLQIAYGEQSTLKVT